MKITFVLPHAGLAGGIRVVATYAEYLKNRGHDVYVVSQPLAPISLSQRIKSVLKGDTGWHDKRNLSHFDGRDIEHRVLERIRPITDADVPDADVVVATWWETAEWVAALSPSKGAKAYFIQHYEAFDGQPKERVKATWLLPMHKIAIAQWLVDLAHELGDDAVSLVPNSVDTQQFFALPRSKQTVPTVGVMYSGAAWKGCDICLNAVTLAAKQVPNLRLISFGSEQLHSNLPLPPTTNYLYRPAQESIKNIYAQCDAWLFGSRSEGFGMPVLEAMACRTPVIGTPAGAVPELLTGGSGIIVNPNDPEDMARAIEQICCLSNDDWQAMSDAAYAKATGYTWDDATACFEAALQTAIERSKRGELSHSTSTKNDDRLQMYA
jgi:glycosyltransferase involved in cell wall biosynthesis